MMFPIVSIIIPVFNSELYLSDCLDSVCLQTFDQIEIILINDGSQDSSGEICEQYSQRDSRCRVIHTENKGVSAARNKGLKTALGKYIMFVDSDDSIEPDMIEDMVARMESLKVDLCVRAMENQTDVREDHEIALNREFLEWILFLHRNYLVYGPTSKLFRKELIDKYNISFPIGMNYGEDLMFNMAYLGKSSKVFYLHDSKYHYSRENARSLSLKTRWDMFENDFLLFKTLYQWFDDYGLMTDQVYQFLYNRLFDTAYNSICLIFKKDCAWPLATKKRYLRSILQNHEVKKSFQYIRADKYPGKIVKCMKEEKYWLLLGKSMITGEGNA